MAEKPPKVKRTEFRSCGKCGALTASRICPDCGKEIE